MPLYKALLTDVDGTLIPNAPKGLPSQKVLDAMKRAQHHLHIGIATSRPLFFAQHIFDTIAFTGPSIVSGGTQIFDATTRQVIWERPLELDIFWQVIELLLPHTEHILINEGDRDGHFSREYKAVKPLGICVDGISSDFAETLIASIAHLPEIHVTRVSSHQAGKVAIDVTHARGTKHHGVFEVARILGIETNEIIGIGDGYNDIPLLQACGLKIAMGHAPEELKAIADYVAPDVEHDGLADVIEKFVLMK